MQTQKWVNLGLLIGTFAAFLFVNKLTGFIWDLARLPVPAEWPIEPVYILSFAISAGAGLATRQSPRANGFLNEVTLELSKVTWPNRKETIASAGVVIVLLGICALILFLIDNLWGIAIRGALST